MIIDTHVHLETDAFKEDLETVLARGREAGIGACILPGADPADLAKAIGLCEAHEDLFFAAGVHPYHAHEYDREAVKAALSHPKCVAVGECGLDYYRLPEDPDAVSAYKAEQKMVFADQIALAKEAGLPLIVHIRDASDDSLTMLKELDAGKVGGVLHCYNADHQLLVLAKEGFYFGIGGVLTFKNARKLLEVLPKIPREKLLIETDAPYLTPHPHRGKRNEPAYCLLVAEKMADLLGESLENVIKMTTENAFSCFRQLKVMAG